MNIVNKIICLSYVMMTGHHLLINLPPNGDDIHTTVVVKLVLEPSKKIFKYL